MRFGSITGGRREARIGERPNVSYQARSGKSGCSIRLTNLWRWLPCLVAALAVAGCGAEEEAALQAPTREVVAAGATVTGGGEGCWAQAVRAPGTATGGAEMPSKQYSEPPAMVVDPARHYAATLETNKGAIDVELFPGDAPKTVNNFVCLARDGFYDNTPFHRIVKGFVIQGGDPTGTGSGGPGYQFEDEPIAREYERGTLAMANAGPNTNGSQFFIVLADLRRQLPKNYTIFGRVTGGQEVVDQIAAVPTRRGPSGEQSQPTEAVTLERVTVREQ